MSFREQLHAYITQLEKRLRWSALLRGLAILTGSALVATLVLVAIANAIAFSQGSVTAARFGLILILVVAAAAGLALVAGVFLLSAHGGRDLVRIDRNRSCTATAARHVVIHYNLSRHFSSPDELGLDELPGLGIATPA